MKIETKLRGTTKPSGALHFRSAMTSPGDYLCPKRKNEISNPAILNTTVPDGRVLTTKNVNAYEVKRFEVWTFIDACCLLFNIHCRNGSPVMSCHHVLPDSPAKGYPHLRSFSLKCIPYPSYLTPTPAVATHLVTRSMNSTRTNLSFGAFYSG
jgi:hypothetical protein